MNDCHYPWWKFAFVPCAYDFIIGDQCSEVYFGRDYLENREFLARNMSHMTDFLSDETEKGPPLQTHTLREFEKLSLGSAQLRSDLTEPALSIQLCSSLLPSKHLNDLKKENFSLKLRIYFLEERIQQKYEDSSEDVYRRNIELKVEVESLKQELQEKQQLLDTALTTAESLTNQNEAELQRRCEERQQEIDHMQEILETKIQLLQEEAKLARNEAEKMASHAEAETLRCFTLEKRLKESSEGSASLTSLRHQQALAEKDRIIDELTQELHCKVAAITELSDEKTLLSEKVGALEDQVHDLTSSLQQKERDAEGYLQETNRWSTVIHSDVQMKDACRICARELCGNQRRWIFHTASKLNLQVLLSHVLGRELTRDGKREFACSKCAFMLDRVYRFDTVIARIEALSIERLQRLLQEKERLRQCIGSLYRKTNGDEAGPEGKAGDGTVDISGLPDVRYSALLQEDFAYSGYESWAEHEEQMADPHHHCHASEISVHRSRRCRGCAALRVADSDYEAVCKVPRKLARSISCGPSTRYSASVMSSVCGEEPVAVATVPESVGETSGEDADVSERMSPGSSVESLDTAVEMGQPAAKDEEAEREMREDQKFDSWPEEALQQQNMAAQANRLDLALSLVKNVEYRPIQSPRGSKLPVLVKSVPPGPNSKMAFADLTLRTPYGTGSEFPAKFQEMDMHLELSELEELWQDVYEEYMPFSFQNLIEEQQSQLNQYECAAGQCVTELQKAQLQVQSLQIKIHDTEATNKKLQEKLREMESELRAIKQAAQKQERTIQGLSETVTSKDTEAEELYRVIEGQNDTLCKLRDMAHRNQLQQLQVSQEELDPAQLPPLQAELLNLQNSLFSTQLELQSSQRAHRHSERQASDLARDRDRLHSDLQEALQHREATEQHNQELRSALQQARTELQARDRLLKEKEAEKQMEIEARGKTIQQLQVSLQEKEQLIQEYVEHLDYQQDSGESRDALLDKLRERIKDRDRALERAIDEKFRCLEEKESEVRRLQLTLREKERDLERLRCILSNNEETITSLDGMLRVKALELEQVSLSGKNLQWLKQEAEDKHSQSLRERDAIISQLQTSLLSRTKEAEELTAALLDRVSVGGSQLAEELRLRLQLKERLLQEALADRSRQASEHDREVQELLNTVGTRDQQNRETVGQLSRVISERAAELQELRRQLYAREREVSELARQSEQHGGGPRNEIGRLKSLLQEKDAFIEDEPMITSKPGETLAPCGEEGRGEDASGLHMDMQAMQDDLQLVLRKEQEAQSVLTKQREEIQIQAANIESLTRSLQIKDGLIKDLHSRLVEPSGLPVAEQRTQELQEVRQPINLLEAEDKVSIDHQHVLGQLVLEYKKLNEALKAEKELYHSLAQLHTHGDSSEKSQALQGELDTIQALRGQLEEALARTRDGALRLERAAMTQPDFGESHIFKLLGSKFNQKLVMFCSILVLPASSAYKTSQLRLSVESYIMWLMTLKHMVVCNSHNLPSLVMSCPATGLSSSNSCTTQKEVSAEEEEDDDEDGSSEFTDSIEEDENSKLTALTMATKERCLGGRPLNKTESQDALLAEQGLAELRCEVQQLMEQKGVAERELRELKTQLESTGYASLSQMRNALLSLRLENDKLKGQRGQETWGRWESGEAGWLTEGVGRKKEAGVKLRREERQIPEEETACGPEPPGPVAGEGELGLAQGKRCAPAMHYREGQGKRRCTRPQSLDLGALLSQDTDSASSSQPAQLSPGSFWEHVEVSLREQSKKLRSDLALSLQDNRELQERLMVSEATVQAQAEQLKEYRVLLCKFCVYCCCSWDSSYLKCVVLQYKNVPFSNHLCYRIGCNITFAYRCSAIRNEISVFNTETPSCSVLPCVLKWQCALTDCPVCVSGSLAESSVEQDSKQVQVDLQDLGYETCGRSENEAEREDASSPEYEDLDVHGAAYGLAPQPLLSSLKAWPADAGELGKCDDVAALQQHIQDLRAQLRRSEKLIRNLQRRARSFSTTSDYASSLERPRKVNWNFQAAAAAASPTPSGAEEDEGWQSDGVAGVPAPRPNKELQELVARVASLEAQLKSSRMDGKASSEDLKSATWPGKYDSLIQAQARELSHLRQKMRVGRGVCHILSQHLGDTTKSFEELLRGNDIDYYMGQSFREQLAQSLALAERVNSNLSDRSGDRPEVDDKTGHELLALRPLPQRTGKAVGHQWHKSPVRQGTLSVRGTEELMAPLWKLMLSKSNPLYRESLFSFSLWECRAQERELLFLRKQAERERRALHRELDKLSKELQQKDKIIDSLRSKLQQRSDTPSSSHALSETTDQSDRTSFVSDDHASTNEELELCSDMDAASEYTQEEATGRGSPGQAITDPHSHSGTPPQHPSVPSSTTASHGAQSSNNNPIIPCTQHKPMDLNQAQTESAHPLEFSCLCPYVHLLVLLNCPQRVTFIAEGLYSSPLSGAAPFPQPHYCPDPSGPPGSLPFDPQPLILGPSYHGAAPFSLAEVHQELQMLQRQLGESYAVPHVKPMASFPLASHSQPESSSFAALTRHPFHQPQLGCPANANGALKAQAGLLDDGTMWDMSHLARPGRASNYGDVSSGSSGYQSGTGHTGADLIEEHLSEIRSLQQRLEDSICTNNRLRQQLEERLATAGRDSGPPTNIYIQGLESVSQLSNENRALREENLGLQARLNQASRESSAEMEELREAVLSGRARLKEAELEAEQWREESRRLQAQSCEQEQEIQQLRQEKQASQERNNGLQHEVNLQQQQLDDNRQLLHSLQCELQVYDRVCRAGQSPHSAYRGGAATALELNELLAEVRGLRVQLEHSIQENSCLREQLEQQLGRSLATHRASRPSSISITTTRDTGCKRQLFQDPVPSPPVRDTGMFNPGSPFTLFSKSTDLDDPDVTGSGVDILQPNTVLEGEAPDGSFANKNGRHAIGHVDDFSALQQQILEGKMLVHKMEAVLQSSLSAAVNTGQSLDCSSVKTLLSNTKTLRQILDEAASLLKMFWRAALPSGESCAQHIKKEQSMTEEIQKLQRKITEQEGLLQSTIERLRNTNRTKESMEHFIVSQLSRTRDVLKKARTNLEKNEYQISSLSSSSPCAGKAAIPRCPREPSSDWGFLSFRKQEPARKRTSHRPTKTRNGQCLLQVVTY
ncbi:MYOME protein, partial [Atractosteus spatula]|nr:MYOME protein [Atractosteus spatula]